MPRLARIEYPGACYHVRSQGRNGRRLLAEAGDRRAFLDSLGAAASRTGWRVLAFCLSPADFQLVLQTPEANLADGMKWLLGRFTGGYHRRHATKGALFRARYRALLIQPPPGPWLGRVIDYVHLTPARRGLITATTPLADHPVSSLPAFLSTTAEHPRWLNRQQAGRALREADFQPGEQNPTVAYAIHLDTLRREAPLPFWRRIERGWCLGDDAFKNSMTGWSRGRRAGSLKRGKTEDPTATAERIIREELAALGWDEQTLARSPKMAPAKAHIAGRLRRETLQTLAWIARRLHMGSVNTARNLLLIQRQAEAETGATAVAAAMPEPWLEEFDVRWD
ncbi:MAG: hypothetical protein H7A46_14510 [Verrucomicrobiales bacterium]|nr:hypothetical protein [Verrucomicrobiales bacterium]